MKQKIYQFIKSCVRREAASMDDLGYLTKWAIQYEEDTEDAFFEIVEENINSGFFDNNRRISEVFSIYKTPTL